MVNSSLWAQEISDKIKSKMIVVAARNKHKIPYTTENGVYDDWTDKNICWWTNGFWGGIMWQMYHATENNLYREIAIEVEEKLDRNLMNHGGMDHDSGFKWLPTSGAHYRKDGDKAAYNRVLLAADNLAGRLNTAGGFLRAWNDPGSGDKAGWAIIDCMMNLPLLYWASELTKDPRYNQIARIHANMAKKYFVRDDGSVKHIVEFDPLSGEYIRSHGGQGYKRGSVWTRGQAWAIYGFALSHQYTHDEEALKYAVKTADYFIENIPEKHGIPVDFMQPEDCVWEDSTAAVIAACGMLEIKKYMPEDSGKKYEEAALKLLHFVAEERCNWTEETDNIVERCTAAYHDKEHEFAIVYGDYFFIEAIWKLTEQELFIW
ncbi:MAG TPA: glycoside hydrolase family 88 protein [Candidatus Merdenecus merdavium]|nr:glycoside hydrolase family 88 protein [Candidatus Merdenecus merdavium]